MKILIINKSDSTGGAAVVSRRLMEALRESGQDARMLVVEKLTDSPYVRVAASPSKIKRKFLRERLSIFLSNGFNRKTLFQIDNGSKGLPLWKHPWVKNADAIMINWVNQGMLSLRGIKKILKTGKPVIWTMHDMWPMTGICHHAGSCNHYLAECGDCPLLGRKQSSKDLSHKVWRKKRKIYINPRLVKHLAFAAVSRWLKEKALESSLLKEQKLEVIPNAFKPVDYPETDIIKDKTRILFGAARLDDPIKGLDTLKAVSRIIATKYPDIAKNLEIALFGNVKKQKSLDGFSLPVVKLGVIQGEEQVAEVYRNSDIVVSASSYETLPGTLVEAQAYGCVPVAFLRGGQKDIVDQLATGYLAEYDEDPEKRALNLTQGILWAYSILQDPFMKLQIKKRMKQNVEEKFSYKVIADKYVSLIKKLK